MIQKAKYVEAREFWLVFCPRFMAEHGEEMRALAQLTAAEQLAPPTPPLSLTSSSSALPLQSVSSSFLEEHPFV